MERLRRLTEFWSWLPAFRAVAETAHLPSAAKALLVSPSALSRSIGLLEKSVGRSLFKREGKRLELNPSGERFLAHLRDAMRLLDDGLSAVDPHHRVGPVHLSAEGPLCHLLLPAFLDFQEASPGMVLHIHNLPEASANPLLLRGQLDVAFLSVPIRHDHLHVEALGSAHSSIYCGKGHPLYRARRIPLEKVLQFPFAAPIPGEVGFPEDRWPAELPRRVDLYVAHLLVTLEVCRRGRLLAVLPDQLARSSSGQEPLRRLPLDIIPAAPIHAVRRVSLAPGAMAEEVIGHVKRSLANRRRRRSRERG